jgi:predicted nucleotidyltransferase
MVVDPLVELPEKSENGPVATLERRVGATWPSLAKARIRARETREMLGRALESACSSELSIVVYGSLARDEFTAGSDVDWTLLIDGPADYRHLDTAHDIDAELEKLGMKEPSRDGAFGAMTFSHDLVHQIGGEDDRNSNTTRRILLLLESAALDPSNVRRDVITKVLGRYILEEPTFARGTKTPRVPRFLLNDFARYWRTMAVDFAHKARTGFGKKSALRNLKLRMSRKLIFVSGLLSCFSCHLSLARADGQAGCPGRGEACVACLRGYMDRRPLDAFAHAALGLADKHPENEKKILLAAAAALTAYDEFLQILSDKGSRDRLEALAPDAVESDSLFSQGRQISHSFQEAIDSFFFDGHPELGKLTRRYGVF